MRVFRGRLVHCKVPERIEVLEDHLIGFEERELGRVSELLFVMLTGTKINVRYSNAWFPVSNGPWT